jgi:hypothetical protein
MDLSYRSAEVYIYENGLQKALFPTSTLDPTPSHRLDMLYACVISTKGLLDSYLMHPSSFFEFSALDLGHLGHGLSTLLKLSVLDDPCWDLAYLRRTVDLVSYLNQLIEKFEAAAATLAALQLGPNKESFSRGCARAMKRVQNWYEARLAAEAAQNVSKEQNDAMQIDDMMGVDQFDYMNDVYWLELMGDAAFLPAP